MSTLFIFGLGYTGRALAWMATLENYAVSGVGRDEFDDVHDDMLACATHIVSTIPPTGEGDPVLNRYGSKLGGKWLSYLSTTGVYGDYAGEWVDENSALKGQSPRLIRRIAAENAWLEKGAHIFRLAGIYGPARNVFLDIRKGEAKRIDKEGQFFSRIHVEDITGVLLASMARPQPGTIYNVCDDAPAPSHEVVKYACELLAMTPPPLLPYDQAQLSPMAQEFYAANRRVSNERIKRELGYQLKFPTYKEGLAQLLQTLPVL